MPQVALTFAILDHGYGPDQVGYVLGASLASMVVLLLVGGIIADRVDRRRAMLGADLVRFVAQGLTAVLLLSGQWQVWELVVLQLVWGAAAAVFAPATTGLVPALVAPGQLHGANALQSISQSLAIVIGPALAGALVAGIGPGAAMAVDAATFAASAASLAFLKLPRAVNETAGTTMRHELAEGWRTFRGLTWVWVVVTQFGLWSMLCYAPTLVLGAVVAKQRLGGAAAWGVILAAFGVGALIGAVLTLRGTSSRPLLLGESLMLAFGLMPLGLLLPVPLPVVCVFAGLGGVGFELFSVVWTTSLQHHVPANVLSRVSAYDQFGSIALMPVGFAIAGPVSAVLGVRTTLAVAAAGVVVLGTAALAVPSVRGLREIGHA
jgi:MFS family permease